MSTISLRGLNRTLLTRQYLAERTSTAPLDVIRHLVAVQGQEPNWPYVALWSRVDGFARKQLQELLDDRSVVRSTMIRRTVHVAASEDFRWLRPSVTAIVEAALKHPWYLDEIRGLDLGALATAGHSALTGEQPLPRTELGKRLAVTFPGRHAKRLADTVELLLPLVHDPACGSWGSWASRRISVALAEEWLGEPMIGARPETMILRYLAAFGPAGVMDIQAWAGVTRLREIVERLRPRLQVWHDQDGRELFDLPGAPIADPDLPVPVRFLPAFDNALLGYRDRTRMMTEDIRRRFARAASGGVPMYTVDGFVHGVWSTKGSALTIEPLHPLGRAGRAAVEDEAERLLAFMYPEDDAREVRVAD
ncbi:winged helix DNA-binding domain-containing protein [Longispora albida]|uniref:winged helix DNA-binding domain-containing protein n=1 Tax=Longispora albida TaxID=203523 RepID=UPI000381ECF8|nr:winged helix DNA-binding domain-containing protein [Longispora albida]